MANNATDEFKFVSKVRTGFKREFAFASKSQNEIVGSLGRTRNRSPASVVDGVPESPSSKRFNKWPPEELGASVDAKEPGFLTQHKQMMEIRVSSNSNTPAAKHLGELSGDSLVEMLPRKLKYLLDTGLLEGLSVRYPRGVKPKLPKETDLRGVVKGSEILCFCEDCKGETVVTPSVFEVHAGSANRCPTDYIYLKNGNTFRDVLNACKECDLDDVEAAIKIAIDRAAEAETAYCINCCEGSISGAGKRNARELCYACKALKNHEESPKRVTEASDSPQEKPLHRSSDNAKKYVSLGNKCEGRLTRNDLQLHKLLLRIMYCLTELKWDIMCVARKCYLVINKVLEFSACAAKRRYLHIYTSNGVSLHELSLSLSKERKLSCGDNDDLCSICLQHGYLLCCDGCPRAFHQECLPLLEVPDGDWYCRHCEHMFQREKYAECNTNAVAAGRVAGVDPIDQIKCRHIRIVKPQESEGVGCALCRTHDFAKGGFSRHTIMLCDHCEREFHVGCLQDRGMQDLKELPEGKWFCSSGCNRISSALQQLI